MGFLIFLGAVAVIVVWVFACLQFRRIAAVKGFDEAKYFWWTFFLGPVGMLMVVALPDHGPTSAPVVVQRQEASDELPDL